MPGRFTVLTDEHIPMDLVESLRRHGWTVVRVEDEPGLGKSSPDPKLLTYALEKGCVWLTRDGRLQKLLSERLRQGQPNPAVVCWLQRYRRLSVGHIVRCLEQLAEEGDPFSRGVRYIKPSGV